MNNYKEGDYVKISRLGPNKDEVYYGFIRGIAVALPEINIWIVELEHPQKMRKDYEYSCIVVTGACLDLY